MDDTRTGPQFRTRPCKSVLMIGTHPSGKGGIASVVRAYMESKFFASYPITYIPVHRQGGAGIKVEAALQGWLQVLITLLRTDAPLLHIHLSSRASVWRKLVVCRLASAFRRPYILHVHASEFMQFYEDECSSHAKHVVQEMFENAALILALSEQWKFDLARISPDARIEVLSNAVQLPELAPQQLTSIPNQTVLFLGRLGSRKGTGDLIRAFAKIANAFPNARLICAGDGDVELFARLACELEIDNRVDFPGWLSAPECQEQLGNASIFALPSYAEGLPMALLEAMSWKLPVIASPVGGIPQLISYGENGLLVEAGNVQGLADALATLLSRPTLCERLGAKARQTVEEGYSFEAHIRRLSDIYSLFGLPAAAPGEHHVLVPEANDRAPDLPGPNATGLRITKSARDSTADPHPE